jgi:hypothetical protein
MLKDFNKFIYEFENIYLKELDTTLILNYIENFYNYFLMNNNNIDNNLVKQTANVLIIAIDDIILQKKELQLQWMNKTGENKILNSNRGGEIFDNIIKDIINGTINNFETINIIAICFILGARSDYKKKFFQFFKESNTFYPVDYKKNIESSSIYKYKNESLNLLVILITGSFFLFIITEIHYIITIQGLINKISKIFFEIRGIYGS